MDINDIYSGETLKASDLQGHEPTVIISGWSVKEFEQRDGKITKKIVLSFDGKKKVLVTNVTNARRIAYMYGDNPEGWVGKTITLYVEPVDFGGKLTDAIRVRVEKKSTAKYSPDRIETGPQPTRKPVARPSLKDEMDEEIPF